MDSSQLCLLVFGLILVVGVQSSFGIKCYVCNSGYPSNEDDCLNPTSEYFVKDCNEYYKESKLNYTYCRKAEQTVEGDFRIVRSCASKARLDRTCIERTGTKAIRLKYCECEDDLCNTAAVSSINLLLLTAVSGLLALIYHS